MSRPTDDAESEIVAVSVGGIEIDEHEHQALDLLDEHPRGSAQDAVSDEVGAAVPVVRELLLRMGTQIGLTLIDAASQLARTPDRGRLEVATLDEIRLTLAKHPPLSFALGPVVQNLDRILSFDRTGMTWDVLCELVRQALIDVDERLYNCSLAIAERLAAAQPAAGVSVPRALRVFRSAVVAEAGPSIRAQQLAADHPEHLRLALALVEQHADAATLVDAFDQARAVLEAATVETKPDAPPQIDGPKRKFTYVHVILALIVLGLTLWHYVFR